MDPVMIALDADKDGELSAEEIANAPVALKSLDKDGDGALSAGELRMRQQTPRQRAEHLFDEWDTNKDGALLKEEMPDRMQAQFEAIDTNHDGKVDIDEATAYVEKMPTGRPGGQGGAGGGGQRPQAEGQPRQ
ncbi:MAG: EF-hand domain-containing protein [Terriglobus sp.]